MKEFLPLRDRGSCRPKNVAGSTALAEDYGLRQLLVLTSVARLVCSLPDLCQTVPPGSLRLAHFIDAVNRRAKFHAATPTLDLERTPEWSPRLWHCS